MRKYPIGWKTVKLEAVAEFFNGKPLEGRVTPDGNSSLITLDSVDIKGQLKNNHKKLNADGDFLKAGDIVSVLSDIAHGYLLGLSAVIPADDRYVLNQRMGLLRTSSEIDPNYLRLFINFNQSYFRERGQGTSQRHIYKRDFYDFDFSYPPLSEQKTIANALSDIDELIANTNNEIRKYKDLFRSMSDNLLNPSKNLISKFDNRRLGDLAEIVPGGTPSTAVPEFWNGDILWATPTDITATKGKYIATTKRKISPSGLKHASKILPIGSILLCTRATIGESKIAFSPITTNQGFKNLLPNSGVNNQWLYYVLRTKIDEMKSLSSGSTFLELGTKNLANIEISTPSSKEQIEFGKALSDVDDLIDAFSSELAKYECIKQGMAHDLLTGKVRLV